MAACPSCPSVCWTWPRWRMALTTCHRDCRGEGRSLGARAFKAGPCEQRLGANWKISMSTKSHCKKKCTPN